MNTTNPDRELPNDQLKHLRIHITEQPYWEYVSRTNSSQGVTIVALTGQKEILVIRQHRIPLGTKTIELPAGLVGDEAPNERPEDAVMKELLEETGYSVERHNVRKLAAGPTLAGLTNEINALYLATDAYKTSEGEAGIETLALPLTRVMDELAELEQQGSPVDLKVYAGLHFLPGAQR